MILMHLHLREELIAISIFLFIIKHRVFFKLYPLTTIIGVPIFFNNFELFI